MYPCSANGAGLLYRDDCRVKGAMEAGSSNQSAEMCAHRGDALNGATSPGILKRGERKEAAHLGEQFRRRDGVGRLKAFPPWNHADDRRRHLARGSLLAEPVTEF